MYIEQELVVLPTPLFMGLPPHMWRILRHYQIFILGIRSGSIYVETTLSGTQVLILSKDHLHTRREYCHGYISGHPHMGSSPLTWRTRETTGSCAERNRIISIYMENTSLIYGINYLLRDHLHIRGEHKFTNGWKTKEAGSSPHTWRTRNF